MQQKKIRKRLSIFFSEFKKNNFVEIVISVSTFNVRYYKKVTFYRDGESAHLEGQYFFFGLIVKKNVNNKMGGLRRRVLG